MVENGLGTLFVSYALESRDLCWNSLKLGDKLFDGSSREAVKIGDW